MISTPKNRERSTRDPGAVPGFYCLDRKNQRFQPQAPPQTGMAKIMSLTIRVVSDNDETRAALVNADLPDSTNVIWSGAALVIVKELNCCKTKRIGRSSCLVAAASLRQV
jgi:hypothetical protein